jgi:hypothetical protein
MNCPLTSCVALHAAVSMATVLAERVPIRPAQCQHLHLITVVTRHQGVVTAAAANAMAWHHDIDSHSVLTHKQVAYACRGVAAGAGPLRLWQVQPAARHCRAVDGWQRHSAGAATPGTVLPAPGEWLVEC